MYKTQEDPYFLQLLQFYFVEGDREEKAARQPLAPENRGNSRQAEEMAGLQSHV